SSKGLSKLLNSHMSAKDKSGLGYKDQIHEGVLSYENEVLESVFDSRSSDVEDSLVDSVSCESNSSVETLKFMPKLAVNEPKAVGKPKVGYDAPIIEEYEETVKEQNICSPSPKADKRDWNGLMSKKLGFGYGFTKKACFVCDSFSHLIRDCDFHKKRMAKQVELNKKKGKGTGQGENRPMWNNVQRLNHQNKFVTKADDPQKALKNKGIVDSGCSRHMTGNKLDFENVYFVKELKQFNLFFVSQMCDKKNKVLFTDSECLVLSLDFKLPNENQVKTIRCDNGTEFKNSDIIELNSVGQKGSRGNIVMPKLHNKMELLRGRTVNDVSYIKAKVAGKTVSISEASIRRDLLFHDVDGIDCLTNQEIDENLQMIGSMRQRLTFLQKKLASEADEIILIRGKEIQKLTQDTQQNADKNDSFAFVHELKQEMHADLKYVESLEKEIDELESDKAKISNMYDML
ncbi:hypothetical protein Tco_0572967, partial [Tanacetum coccineum]